MIKIGFARQPGLRERQACTCEGRGAATRQRQTKAPRTKREAFVLPSLGGSGSSGSESVHQRRENSWGAESYLALAEAEASALMTRSAAAAGVILAVLMTRSKS